MDTTLLIVLLGVALLAIVVLPGLFRRKNDAGDAAGQMNGAPAPRPPLMTTLEQSHEQELVRWLCEQASAQTGINLARDPMALTRISEAAKKVQTDIDADGHAELSLPYIAADASGPKHFQLAITREQWASAGRRL